MKLKKQFLYCVAKKIIICNRLQKLFLINTAFLLLFFTFYHIYFANKIIPGVEIAGIKVGGLEPLQALEKLTSQELTKDKVIKIWGNNGKIYQIKSGDINFSYDWPASVERALEIGRTGNFYIDTKDKLAGLVKPLKISAKYKYDKDLLGSKIAEIRNEINVPHKDAKVVLNEKNELEIIPEIYGKSLDEEQIYQIIRKSFDEMEFSEKTLDVKDDEPKLTKKDLQEILPNVQNLVLREITLIANNEEFKLTPKDLINLLTFQKTQDKTQIRVNKEALKNLEEKLSTQINRLPLGQVVRVQDGKVIDFKIIQSGLEIDKEKFASDFKKAFFENKKEMQVPIKEINFSKDGAEYGIFALLGSGKSKFTGSAPPRITNITISSKKLNGVLVKPGEEFSFNKTIGEISNKNGYATAYIISQGKTVLGEGGGVCQTSTTLFRAVLNAGLPITSRHPHAYRVGYYEIDSPPGFDASVYQPSLDFRFKNDTPGHILIQSEIDKENSTLEFKIFGTPDGRRVEISEPRIYNIIPAPPPLYQEDPTLPKGAVKQIDFSATGATVEFTRKVIKNNEVLFEDKFKTIYQPWRAVFLVGTKKE